MKRLSELQAFLYVELDDPKRLSHDIEYGLPGWYSLDDNSIFQKGERPTYCRIRICYCLGVR